MTRFSKPMRTVILLVFALVWAIPAMAQLVVRTSPTVTSAAFSDCGVLYNKGGVLDGSSVFCWDYTNLDLKVINSVTNSAASLSAKYGASKGVSLYYTGPTYNASYGWDDRALLSSSKGVTVLLDAGSDIGGTSAFQVTVGGYDTTYNGGFRLLPATSGTAAVPAMMMTADATIQVGQIVMPDAGTNGRFDVNGASATTLIGVLSGTGASAQGSVYPVAIFGTAYVAPAEDTAITRGHYLSQSGTAGYASDSATFGTAGVPNGIQIGKALYSEAVTNTIAPAGCTGGLGCINTALNTPNTGPAGQITLSASPGWAVNDPVIYWNSGGTTPTGLSDGGVYWIISISGANVTISTTLGGSVLVPSTQGNDATQYLQRLPLAAIVIQ